MPTEFVTEPLQLPWGIWQTTFPPSERPLVTQEAPVCELKAGQLPPRQT